MQTMTLEQNFLGQPRDPGKERFFFFLKLFLGMALVGGLFGVLTTRNIISEETIFESLSQVPFLNRVRQLIRSADRSLDGDRDGRINILLLGMGGVRHEGPYLTDTIMIASIEQKTKRVGLVSVPRDLAAPIPGYGWRKINHANALGEEGGRGQGAELAKSVLSELLDLPIHYYLRVDFAGFKKLIDDLGGIDVYADHSFTDTSFPTGQNGDVTTVSFEKGWQQMDGERALQFARSRLGGSGEGSDFARARRQQKILQAVKEKVFSLGTLRSPAKINAVLDGLRDHVTTNFTTWEMISAARLASSMNADKVVTAVLDDSPEGLLTAIVGLDGAYLLAPKNNDWEAVRNLVRNIFGRETKLTQAMPPATVEIQNGTNITGLAAETAELLKKEGFLVVSAGNALTRDAAETRIYDLTGGNKKDELNRLITLLKTEIASDKPPSTPNHRPDFLVILGTDN